MKHLINMGLTLMFLGIAGWLVKDVLLVAEPAPLGSGVDASIEDHQGEIDTFRESNR